VHPIDSATLPVHSSVSQSPDASHRNHQRLRQQSRHLSTLQSQLLGYWIITKLEALSQHQMTVFPLIRLKLNLLSLRLRVVMNQFSFSLRNMFCFSSTSTIPYSCRYRLIMSVTVLRCFEHLPVVLSKTGRISLLRQSRIVAVVNNFCTTVFAISAESSRPEHLKTISITRLFLTGVTTSAFQEL